MTQSDLPHSANGAAAPLVESFRNRDFLLSHVQDTLKFYAPNVLDPSGGFFHFFRDDGSVYDRTTRHLVSTCRFVFNYAMAYRQFGDPQHLEYARHGLRFLREAHWDAQHQGYDWELEWRDGRKRTLDATRHCYGLAFVLLAYSHAAMAGIEEAKPMIGATFELMEHRFWDAAAGLYADEATADWRVSSYRGQNANMHTTEALLAAHEATGHLVYLDRAERVASNITLRQAQLSQGLVWEHFHADWSVDWHYNEEDSSNIFRPWGFQPGHQTEWAKLLLILERYRPLPWLLPRAVELFDAAMTHAWTKITAASITASARMAPCAITTSISGFRRRRSPRRRCSASVPATSVSGTGTTRSGAIAGRISSITSMARGTASSPATTVSTATKRVPPARPTITRWALAMRCWRTHCLTARPLGPNPRSKHNEQPEREH